MIVVGVSRHNNIISGSYTLPRYTPVFRNCGIPVGHDYPAKSPFFPRKYRTQISAVCCINSIDSVIGRHKGCRSAFFHGKFKSPEINLPKRPLGNAGIHAHPVILLIIAGKMFHGYAASGMALYAFCHCRCHHSRQIRIFRIIFKVTSAQGIPLDIHSRSQPQIHIKFFHFQSYGVAKTLH